MVETQSSPGGCPQDSSAKGFHVLAKVDKGGDCNTKKSDEEDGETEEVGRFAGGAGHRRHDRARGGGRQAHGKGGIIRDTDPSKTFAYLFDRKRTKLMLRDRGAIFPSCAQ